LLEHIAAAPSTWVDRSWAIAHADGSGGVYPNFSDPQLDDWAAEYHGGNYPRLAAVKKAYDPDRFFDFPQSV
jgi:hypothetical protein